VIISKIESLIEHILPPTINDTIVSIPEEATFPEPTYDRQSNYYIDQPNQIYNQIFESASKIEKFDDFCPYCIEKTTDDVTIILKLIQLRQNDSMFFQVSNFAGEPQYLVNNHNVPLQLEWPKQNTPPNLTNPIAILPTTDHDIPFVCEHLVRNLNIRVTTDGNLAKIIFNEKGVPIENEPFYVSPSYPDNIDRELTTDEEFFIVRVKPSDYGTVKLAPIPRFRSCGIILQPKFDFSLVKHLEQKGKSILTKSPKCAACFLPPFYLSRLSLPSGPIWLTVFNYNIKKFCHVVDQKRDPVRVLLPEEGTHYFFPSELPLQHHHHLKLKLHHERRCLRLDNESEFFANFLPPMEADIVNIGQHDERNERVERKPHCRISSKYFDFVDIGMMIAECDQGRLLQGEPSIPIPFPISTDCDKCKKFFHNYPFLNLDGPPITLVAKNYNNFAYFLAIQFKTHSTNLFDSKGNLLIFEDLGSLLISSYKTRGTFCKNYIKVKTGYITSTRNWRYSKSLSYSHLCKHLLELINLRIDENHHLSLTWPLCENPHLIYFSQQKNSKSRDKYDYEPTTEKRPIVLSKNSIGPINIILP
jgi:hypothetical protein